MYIPRANQETRPEVLHHLMESHPLAALITMGTSGLIATHLPLLIESGDTAHGTLRGHISRANQQWREFSSDIDALAIFAGPQHYISPNWYPEKAVDGKVVPTWNYAVVHAYGPLTIIEDPEWLRAHLQALTNRHEAASPTPWHITDAPSDYIASQIKGIVGIEIPIRRLEGKWKVSQNKSPATRLAVERGLEVLNSPQSLAMRDLVSGKRT